MARIRKDEEYNTKRTEIIQASLKILLEEGYDKFGVNHLLRVMDMSKGAFFHYFKSKNDLLEGVLEFLSQPIIDNMISIMENPNISAIEKFSRLYQDTASIKVAYGEGLEMLSQALYMECNKPVLNNVIDRTIKACQPIYEAVIKEGNIAGVFDVKYVHGTAYHILAMTVRLNQAIAEYMLSDHDDVFKDQLIEKIDTFEFIVQTSLNCPHLKPLYDFTILKKGGIL